MNQDNQIIIYQTADNQTQIDVRLENETVWLTTNQMAMLFGREESNIRRHVINVFKEGELEKENNVHFLHVNGVKKPVPFYNLDVIISVGYRVKSQHGVQFRQCIPIIFGTTFGTIFGTKKKITKKSPKWEALVINAFRLL